MDPMNVREIDEAPTGSRQVAGRKSPRLAAILSLLPGLGQVYVGHYLRGFIHIVVIGMAITIVDGGGAAPLLGLFIAFFWIFGLIDAARLATAWNDALLYYGMERLPDPVLLPSRGNAVAAGALLVGAGILSLLHVRFGVPMHWLTEWWPLVPIGFGAWLLYRGLQDRAKASRDTERGIAAQEPE